MITVFGSINVDLVCQVEAIPGPGQTVHGSDYVLVPGGKGANQALAARRAGAEVRMIGAIGTDGMAEISLAELRAAGVDLERVAVAEGTTGLALITVDRAGENAIVVSPGANARASSSGYEGLDANANETMLFQMEVPFAETMATAHAAAGVGMTTVLSIAPFSPLPPESLDPFDMIVVNEHEAGDLAAAYGMGETEPAARIASLSETLGKTVIATLGPNGAIAANAGGVISVPAIPVDVVDTTGAGDTFVGSLAAFLDGGMSLGDAMARAAVAGSLACTRSGAQPSFPTRNEIDTAHAAQRTVPTA